MRVDDKAVFVCRVIDRGYQVDAIRVAVVKMGYLDKSQSMWKGLGCDDLMDAASFFCSVSALSTALDLRDLMASIHLCARFVEGWRSINLVGRKGC